MLEELRMLQMMLFITTDLLTSLKHQRLVIFQRVRLTGILSQLVQAEYGMLVYHLAGTAGQQLRVNSGVSMFRRCKISNNCSWLKSGILIDGCYNILKFKYMKLNAINYKVASSSNCKVDITPWFSK